MPIGPAFFSGISPIEQSSAGRPWAGLLAALSIRSDQDSWRLMLSYAVPRHRYFTGKVAALSLLGLVSSVVLFAMLLLAATINGQLAEAVGLGYLGVDIVIDAEHGPMLLEANARPGLAIQIANGRGLLPRLEAIDALLDEAPRTLSLEQFRAARRVEGPLRKSA